MLFADLYRSLKKNLFPPGTFSRADYSRQDQYLQSMAVMHERLYQSRDLARIDFSDYLHHLISHVLGPLISERRNIRVRVETADVLMELDTAVLCGSLVHELVLNALNHAFPAGQAGEITIELGMDDSGRYRLIVHDTGIGLPLLTEAGRPGTPGMDLIGMLVDQLCGKMEIKKNEGTTFYIIFTGPHS